MGTFQRGGSKQELLAEEEPEEIEVEVEHSSPDPVQKGKQKREGRFLDLLKARPSKEWLVKASRRARRRPSLAALRRAASIRPRIKWRTIFTSFRKWVSRPKNAALFAWILAVAVGLFVYLLLLVGALNGLIPEGSRRKNWIEANNQILNALFTILCLYEHPKLLQDLVLILRWTANDAAHLRAKFCKYTAPRRRERLHLFLVVALLHVTCFAQYTLLALYLGYSRTNRPGDLETACIALGIGTPIVAAVYALYGPLGRKREVADVESSAPENVAGKGSDTAPARWVGGLFDCRDDPAVSWLSLWCTFCVFGWNMERLGFGNMYVHVATFVLFCLAPFLVFAGASRKIENHAVQAVVAGIGVALSFLGLLYGGYWRIQMRKRFRLPESRSCCGHAGATDCANWLFCWSCALAQEVRTGNFYDVEDDSFCGKEAAASEEKTALEPLPREGGQSAAAVVEAEEKGVMLMAPPVTLMVVVADDRQPPWKEKTEKSES